MRGLLQILAIVVVHILLLQEINVIELIPWARAFVFNFNLQAMHDHLSIDVSDSAFAQVVEMVSDPIVLEDTGAVSNGNPLSEGLLPIAFRVDLQRIVPLDLGTEICQHCSNVMGVQRMRHTLHPLEESRDGLLASGAPKEAVGDGIFNIGVRIKSVGLGGRADA